MEKVFPAGRTVNLTTMATVLWAAGFVLNAALLVVLLYKRRYRVVPWFTVFIAAGCAYTIALFLGFRFSSKHVYAVIYWSCDFIDLLLQVAVVLEIARIVLQRSGRWVEGARLRLTIMGASAPVIAGVMALLMKPAAETRLDGLYARGSLFATMLVFLLFVSVVAASFQLGLGWQNFAMRVSYGLVIWVSVGFMTDTLHSYWRTLGHFSLLENVHIVVFQIVTIFWVVAFWVPERVLAPATASEILSLEAVRRRLEYGQR